MRTAFILLRRVCWPLLDLGFRIWLAQQFFVSGLIKVTHWETASGPRGARVSGVVVESDGGGVTRGLRSKSIAPIFPR